ncbi:MAG: DUF4112 domain-containing protein, partial [Gemmatimonadaceae bacterium]|nr:DUF4112 domain-containing protein [Gemmatimonadaceae bacterium]
MTTIPDPLARARALTRLLDSAARVPGTSFRFGLDPVLGLIPGLGDVAGAALSGYVVILASRLGAPKSVLVRMLGNVAIDTVAGAMPVVGDLFDAAWKSNTRNLALLERHVGLPTTERAASRAVVWLTVAALAVLALGAIALAIFVVRALL